MLFRNCQNYFLSCSGNILVCLLLFGFLAGCGEDGPERSAVSGKVSLDGKPLSDARILFIPEKKTKGPNATAIIIEGQYKLDSEHGPLIGNMRVEIQSEGIEEAGFQKKIKEGDKKPQVMLVKIPDRYNEETTLHVEVKSDEENVFDFELKSKR